MSMCIDTNDLAHPPLLVLCCWKIISRSRLEVQGKLAVILVDLTRV